MAGAQDFIDALAQTDLGKALLVNAWDSFRGRLTPRSFVRGFFDTCATLHSSRPGHPLQTVREVCLLRAAGGARPHLRQASCPTGTAAAADADGSTWTTLKTWHNWYTYDVRRTAIDATGMAIPAMPGVVKQRDVQAWIDRITRLPGWCQPATDHGGAWLGREPDVGSNCWVSTGDLDKGLAVPPGDTRGSALRVQHALGMFEARGSWLLRYSFPAAQARALVGRDVARPSFADGGNQRYRARDASQRARHYARRHWGTTGHLAPRPAGDGVGRPERVTPGLKVQDLAALTLRAIGRVHGTPNEGKPADILHWLCNGRDADRLVARVRALCRT